MGGSGGGGRRGCAELCHWRLRLGPASFLLVPTLGRDKNKGSGWGGDSLVRGVQHVIHAAQHWVEDCAKMKLKQRLVLMRACTAVCAAYQRRVVELKWRHPAASISFVTNITNKGRDTEKTCSEIIFERKGDFFGKF